MTDENLKAQAMPLSCVGDRFGTILEAIGSTETEAGEVWECGAYRGGTALWMKAHLAGTKRILRAFDTFAGLPFSGPNDRHAKGIMNGCNYDEVCALFEGQQDVHIYRGIMPDTFKGLEDSVISVAHIDVDQYESVKGCLEFVYPRVHPGGWIIIDDYNCGSCPGAKLAVTEFLTGKREELQVSGGANPQAHFRKA